jgi:1-acyl-sn-glycerol-3-phosphate acyltransferase
MGWLVRALRVAYSLAFWGFFGLSCIPLFLGAFTVFLLTRPFDPTGRVLHLYSCFWAQLYFYLNPLWRLHIEGRERLPWRGAAVLVSNHESLGDILVLYGLYRPFKWVSKASVFKAPFIGWNMRLNGYLPLVRGDKESIGQMMAACEQWLRRGVPVLLFPEGTRSPDGEMGAFKDGAFRLAVAVGCPVIPMALSGTRDTLPKRGFVLESVAHCRVRVLEPLAPADFENDVARLRDATREHILLARDALRAEPV